MTTNREMHKTPRSATFYTSILHITYTEIAEDSRTTH